MKTSRLIPSSVLFLFCAFTSMSQEIPNEKQESEISAMLTAFVDDLNHLRLDNFTANFNEEATIFFPRNSFPMERVEGREAIKENFAMFFESVRSRMPEPVNLNIQPRDRSIDVYGNLAVVTLHFDMGDELHRRTLVLEKEKGQWKIVHLHASLLVPSGKTTE